VALEFRCEDVGLVCGRTVTADAEHDLVEQVRAHARADHGVELNDTLVDYARSRVRRR
jgi:predicted small metal-binding protein